MDESRFSLTTRQAARLAGVEPSVLYMAVKRHGAWAGVKPRKLPNGRLLWPRDAVLHAAGLVPDGDAAPVDLRPWLAFLDACGLPSSEPALRAAGMRLLSPYDDRGRDAAYMVDEGPMVAGVVMAYVDRLDPALRRMTPDDRRRGLMNLRFIAESCLLLVAAEEELKVTK